MSRVMVVDDSKAMRKMLISLLIRAGYKIAAVAENGEEAVKFYKEQNPDVVTMDIAMPIKDGIQAVEEIVSYDPTARVIMISSQGQENRVYESIKAGAKNFIIKPIKVEKFLEVITDVCPIDDSDKK